MDKSLILNAIKDQLKLQFDAAIAEALSAKHAATDEESKAENKYDTRGLEATYIAQAQATRAQKIKEDIYNLSKIDLKPKGTVSIGSLFSVLYTEQDKIKHYFLLPIGGISVEHNNTNIQSLSLDSPLGKMFFKKAADDFVVFKKEELQVLNLT